MPDQDAQATSSAATTTDATSEGHPQDDAETVDTNVPWNKDKRFQEFLGKRTELKEYEALGKPGEVKERLDSVGALETQLAWLNSKIEKLEGKREEGEPKTKEQKDLEALRKQAREQLGEIAPELEHIKALSQRSVLANAAIERAAIRETEKLMKASSLPTGKQDQVEMQSILADIIGADEDLYLDYLINPRGAVQEAFERFSKKYKPSAERAAKAEVQANKEKLKTLPKPHGAGGGAGSEGASAPKSIKEAYERHRATLGG